jgi:hypothetical protein
MPPAAKRVTDRDRGWNRIRKLFGGPDGPIVRVGIQGREADATREGGIRNVDLAVVHEFGAEIAHPGGTPFVVASQGGSARSGGMAGSGRVTFVRKGNTSAIGVTRPHKISIPERSFIRAPFTKGIPKYTRLLKKGARKIAAGKMTRQQLLGILGETIKADMQQAIARGIAPPIKAGTIRARRKRFGKASTKPLIATGQLRQSITWVVKKK